MVSFDLNTASSTMESDTAWAGMITLGAATWSSVFIKSLGGLREQPWSSHGAANEQRNYEQPNCCPLFGFKAVLGMCTFHDQSVTGLGLSGLETV